VHLYSTWFRLYSRTPILYLIPLVLKYAYTLPDSACTGLVLKCTYTLSLFILIVVRCILGQWCSNTLGIACQPEKGVYQEILQINEFRNSSNFNDIPCEDEEEGLKMVCQLNFIIYFYFLFFLYFSDFTNLKLNISLARFQNSMQLQTQGHRKMTFWNK